MPVTNPASGVKPGTVAHFAASTAPAGWLKANGALVSRTLYAALFNAIGTTYGAGDGSTTFALPDLRGEFLRGLDDGRGVDSGRAFGSAQADAMQGHAHGASSTTRFVQHQTRHASTNAGPAGSIYSENVTPGLLGVPQTDGTNGTPRTASETRPRNVALLACIKF